jgi:hypothetical protein
MVRKAKGKVKRCATLILRYYVLCFIDYLPTGWNSPNLQPFPTVSSSRQQILLRQPVNNKHIKLAVRF